MPKTRKEITPEKAHYLLKVAIKQGRIVKSKSCSKCGAIHAKIHGHLEDYSKPLEVVWLCQTCHNILHRSRPNKSQIIPSVTMLQPTLKKVQKIKGSHYVCIPKKFVDFYGIKTGDPVTLLPWGNMIPIVPTGRDVDG